MISVLSPTCTVFACSCHPWVSRVPVGLKRSWTSIITQTADLERAPQLYSSSLCLQTDVLLASHLRITPDLSLYIVWTQEGKKEGCISLIRKLLPRATTAAGKKWTLARDNLCCSWVCASFYIQTLAMACEPLIRIRYLVWMKHTAYNSVGMFLIPALNNSLCVTVCILCVSIAVSIRQQAHQPKTYAIVNVQGWHVV